MMIEIEGIRKSDENAHVGNSWIEYLNRTCSSSKTEYDNRICHTIPIVNRVL